MSLRSALPLLLLAVLAAGCDALSGDDAVTLTGQVVNAESNRPLAGATVQIRTMDVEQTSDSTGTYNASFEVDSAATVQIVAFKTGYESATAYVTVEPGQDLTVPAIALEPSAVGDGTSGPAASITLSPQSSQTLGVTGTGAAETGSLTFVALDADGRPVDPAHAVDIAVSILRGPGGGEFVSPAAPETVRTDENGEAAVTVTSGTAAGVLQVETRATVGGREIRSQPISLVIHGGFPDEPHFTVAVAQKNFPALNVVGLTNAVQALVGDRYGNPVQPGTQVYFTTTGGIIGGSSQTDASGTARVTLVGGNPRPPDGFATVYARTSGPDGLNVETSTPVLFSGVPQISLTTPGLGLGAYAFTVSDQLGNPLAEGTSISVTVEGESVRTTGDLAVTLPDVVSPGYRTTAFSFAVTPEPDAATPPRVERITIEVAGPNGSAYGSRPGNMRTGAAVVGRAPEGRR